MLHRLANRSFSSMIFLIALSCVPSVEAASGYSLRGMTSIGETTFLAVQNEASGRTRLLEVGDRQNRSVYVMEWRSEARQAVIVVGGKEITLEMAKPSLEGFKTVERFNALAPGRVERRPRQLPRTARKERGSSTINVTSTRESQSNVVGGGNASGGSASGRSASNATDGGAIPTANHVVGGVTVPVVARKPRVVSMLPLNSSGLTAEEKESNTVNGTPGQRDSE